MQNSEPPAIQIQYYNLKFYGENMEEFKIFVFQTKLSIMAPPYAKFEECCIKVDIQKEIFVGSTWFAESHKCTRKAT